MEKAKAKDVIQTPKYYNQGERQIHTRWQLILHPRVYGTRRGELSRSDALTEPVAERQDSVRKTSNPRG